MGLSKNWGVQERVGSRVEELEWKFYLSFRVEDGDTKNVIGKSVSPKVVWPVYK